MGKMADVTLKEASPGEKEILKNLLEKYLYEFSQWDKEDVNEQGLYGYPYLDCYWTEEKRYPFLIYADGKLAGLALVNDYPEVEADTDYTMSEFFVMVKYRQQGVGRAAAHSLFKRFPGRWQLKYHPENRASAAFWNRVVGEYTGRAYERFTGSAQSAYADGTLPVVLLFECGEEGYGGL